MSRRVMVIGLDSAPPEVFFGEALSRLPNLARLVERGLHGPLRSCHPPISLTAWAVMTTSVSPGPLGLYGFRHRKGHSYDQGWAPNSYSVRAPRMWDVLGRAGLRSCLVGVPPGYPPKALRGWSVSCFLTPPGAERYTHPAELQDEIEARFGRVVFDVPFRVEDRDRLRASLFEMTAQHFDVARHLAATKPWDFFMVMEVGLDRLHHAFWKFIDPAHPKYEPGNPYAEVADQYYRLLDDRIGELLEVAPDAAVLVVSDHGARAMQGAFCINEWLIERGWLVLERPPDGVVGPERAPIDWSRTRAWGWGGYYARIFLNVEGREEQGIVPPGDYDALRTELAAELATITDPEGRPIPVQVHRPEDLYVRCVGDRPDLMVYLDDLRWRSAGTIGHGTLHLFENDIGPDDCVHSMDGIFVLSDPAIDHGGAVVDGLSLLDVAPTVLSLMGVPVPDDMEGRPVLDGQGAA